MRLAVLVTVVSFLAGSVGLGQPPAAVDVSGPLGGLGDPPVLPERITRPGEIDQLRADVARLQQRLDQLSGPHQGAPTPAPPPGWPPTSATTPEPAAQGLGMTAAVGDSHAWQMSATWKNGLQIESPDEDFRFHAGGM